MRPSLTASYRGILFSSKMALLLPRRHLTLDSTTTTPSYTGDLVITGTPIQPGIKLARSSTVCLSDFGFTECCFSLFFLFIPYSLLTVVNNFFCRTCMHEAWRGSGVFIVHTVVVSLACTPSLNVSTKIRNKIFGPNFLRQAPKGRN